MSKNIFDFPFLRYPRALIDSPVFSHISIEARTLLALIFDRFALSTVNSERFTDENGEIFVIYPVDEVREKIGCSKSKALKIIRELEDNKMIYRRQKKNFKPSMIYLTGLFLNGLNQDPARARNNTLTGRKMKPDKVSESVSNKNNMSNNKLSNNHSSIIGFEKTEDEIKEQIEYDCIVCDANRNLLDELVMIISDVLNGTSETVRVGKDEMPRGAVIARFCKLNSEHIFYVFSKLSRNESEIKNIKSYLITMLYNAPATIEAEVTAEFAYRNKIS